MATLTETAFYARKGVNILIVAVIAIVVLRIAIIGILGLKDRFFPTPPPPANHALGQLPYPNFEGSQATPSGITYQIETVDGKLPVMPPTVTVYGLTPDSRATFGTLGRMKEKASEMGFTGEPEQLEGSLYRFIDPKDPLRTLEIDELSGNFEINYNYGSDQSAFSQKGFTSKDSVIDQARSFFEDQGLMTSDLATGSAEVTYLKLEGQNLVPTTSLANSDAVYVTFSRGEVDDHPTVYPNKAFGLVGALVVGGQNTGNKSSILEASYYHSTVDSLTTGTYEPITTEEAFNRLKKGQAIFASLPTPLPSSIPIRNVKLVYLEPFPPQEYLQPVILFTDDRGFEAYVPAVSSEWLKK